MYEPSLANQLLAKSIIAKKYGVEIEFIEYTTTQDNSEFGLSDLLYFNIIDPNHERYKGAFAVKKEDLHGQSQQEHQG